MINTFKNLCYRKSKKTWICATGSPRKHDTYQYLYFLYAPSYLNKLGLVKGLKKFNSITLFHIFVFIEGPLIRSKNCTKRQIFFFLQKLRNWGKMLHSDPQKLCKSFANKNLRRINILAPSKKKLFYLWTHIFWELIFLYLFPINN